jgi:hypothetical protein
MSLATTPPQLPKLLLMLSSPHDGEVVAAARAIGTALQRAGHDWHDLAKALVPSQVAPDAVDLSTDKSTVSWCFHRRHLLSPGDRRFIESLAEGQRPLSPKQRKWLQDIVAKLERVEAA